MIDARENDKLNSNEEENDDPLNEYRAPVCETCLRVNYTKLSSGECSSKTLDTKPE